MATYLVRPGCVDAVRELLRRHWPVACANHLATGNPAVVYSGTDDLGPFFVEFMEWAGPDATGNAFRNDQVGPIWQDLFACTEARGGRPAVEYPTMVREELFPGAAVPVTVAAQEQTTEKATYLVRPGCVDAVRELLRRHWPVACANHLATGNPAVVYSGTDDLGPFFVEFMEWAGPDATGNAFRNDQVGPIWQDLLACTEPRGGRPAVERSTVVCERLFSTSIR
jgi:hypothetical protein